MSDENNNAMAELDELLQDVGFDDEEPQEQEVSISQVESEKENNKRNFYESSSSDSSFDTTDEELEAKLENEPEQLNSDPQGLNSPTPRGDHNNGMTSDEDTLYRLSDKIDDDPIIVHKKIQPVESYQVSHITNEDHTHSPVQIEENTFIIDDSPNEEAPIIVEPVYFGRASVVEGTSATYVSQPYVPFQPDLSNVTPHPGVTQLGSNPSVYVYKQPTATYSGLQSTLSTPSYSQSTTTTTGYSSQQNVGSAPAPEGFCDKCRQKILPTQKTLKAIGRTYHTDHFQCTRCNSALGTVPFYPINGQPYCQSCYGHTDAPTCAKCGNVVTRGTSFLRALGKIYHPGCFGCIRCSTSLDPNQFFSRNNNPVCPNCYNYV